MLLCFSGLGALVFSEARGRGRPTRDDRPAARAAEGTEASPGGGDGAVCLLFRSRRAQSRALFRAGRWLSSVRAGGPWTRARGWESVREARDEQEWRKRGSFFFSVLAFGWCLCGVVWVVVCRCGVSMWCARDCGGDGSGERGAARSFMSRGGGRDRRRCRHRKQRRSAAARPLPAVFCPLSRALPSPTRTERVPTAMLYKSRT